MIKNMVTVTVVSALFACSSNENNNQNDASSPPPRAQHITQTNVFADTSSGGAANVDPNLVNPWGLAFGPSGVGWVSDNGTGVLTLYTPGKNAPESLVVTVPPPAGAQGPATPSGQVFNATSGFMGDAFIVSTEDGTIAGWQSGTNAALRVDQSATGAVYKGLAIVPTSSPILVAANFNAGKIDVFDTSYHAVAYAPSSAWTDPSIPAGFAPFNVAVIGNSVIVAYAMQDSAKHDDAAGAGNGAISIFDQNGALTKSLVATGGALSSPWALVQSNNGFAGLPAGSLLVGNFGDGTVHAFDMNSGAMLSTLTNATGAALSIDGLWALQFGPDGHLYFTAGPNSEANGLYGYLTSQ
jgi:uncharacterized protein (TIGR03118 family)